jgi:hypothetical protein
MGHLSSFSHNMEEWRAGLLGREKLLPCHNSHVDWQSMNNPFRRFIRRQFPQTQRKRGHSFQPDYQIRLGVHVHWAAEDCTLQPKLIIKLSFWGLLLQALFQLVQNFGKNNPQPTSFSLAVSETGHLPTMLHTHCSCRHSCSGQNF